MATRRRKKRRIKTIKKQYIQLTANDVKDFRETIHDLQDMICPVCGEETEHNNTTLDHQHKLSASEPIGKNGAGLIRGVLCRQCNSYEGKIWNIYRRLGFHKRYMYKELGPISARAEMLRKFADYYESGYIENEDGDQFIHHTEKPKADMMGKQLFNKLNKLYKLKYPRRKPLEVPKSIKKRGKYKGKWAITEKWQRLLAEFDLEG